MKDDRNGDILKARKRAEGHDPSGRSDASEESLNLLEELADFCKTAGEFPTALEYYAQILDIAERASRSGELLAATAFKMAGCLQGTGEFDRALEMLDLALGKTDGVAAPRQAARILISRSKVHLRKGNYEPSRRDAEEALAILQREAISPELGEVFLAVGHTRLRAGQIEEAREMYEASLAMFRSLGDRESMAKCFNNLALVCKNQGHLADAAAYGRKALQIARDLGTKLQIGTRLINLGIIEQKRGRWPAARADWEEALRIFRELGNKFELSLAYLNLAHHYRAIRDWKEAEELYQRALQSSRQQEDRRCEALYYEHYGDLLLRRGEPKRAERILTHGLELARRLGKGTDIECEILRRRGEARTTVDASSEALQDLRASLRLARKLRDRYEEGAVLRALGVHQAARGRKGRAVRFLRRSIRIFAETGARYEEALSATALGGLASDGRTSPAEEREALARAATVLREIGAHYEAALADLVRAEGLAARGEGLPAIELIEKIERTLDREGTAGERARMREVRARSDRLIISTSLSESNTLATFNRILERIQAIRDGNERLRFTLQLIREQTAAERLILVARSGAEGPLEPRASDSVPPKEWHTTLDVARLAVDYSLRNGGKPLYSTSPRQDSRLESGHPGLERIGSLLAIPLRGEGELSGGIYVDRVGGDSPFGQAELDFAVALSSVVVATLGDLRREAIHSENMRLRHRLGIDEGFGRIVTQSPRLLKTIEMLQKLRDSKATILLQGETGTGKELFARAIHHSSSRKKNLFVTVNCAELSEDVLESELFGHRKGAFTDAKYSKTGLFERASGGTVFIDEIDKASRRFQDSLLRVVDRKEIKPVGSTESISVDVRIVCAANKDLREEMERDRFLKDLYYRLRVVSVYLPPLRERSEDVPVLAEHFLRKHGEAAGKRFAGFDPKALRMLAAHDWPGNVRDLEHEIERIVAMTVDGSTIGPGDLSPEILRMEAAPSNGTLPEVVEGVERKMIEEMLRSCKGNKSKTARRLGLSRRGLLNKLARYDIG